MPDARAAPPLHPSSTDSWPSSHVGRFAGAGTTAVYTCAPLLVILLSLSRRCGCAIGSVSPPWLRRWRSAHAHGPTHTHAHACTRGAVTLLSLSKPCTHVRVRTRKRETLAPHKTVPPTRSSPRRALHSHARHAAKAKTELFGHPCAKAHLVGRFQPSVYLVCYRGARRRGKDIDARARAAEPSRCFAAVARLRGTMFASARPCALARTCAHTRARKRAV